MPTRLRLRLSRTTAGMGTKSAFKSNNADCTLHVGEHLMNAALRHLTTLLLALQLGGCTMVMIEKQGKPHHAHYKDCPTVYPLSRMELSSIEWSFSGSQTPTDTCHAHYYPKAAKDSLYQTTNQRMTPLYILSLPVDGTVDTLTLPFAALSN